jgi:hypothetical protein
VRRELLGTGSVQQRTGAARNLAERLDTPVRHKRARDSPAADPACEEQMDEVRTRAGLSCAAEKRENHLRHGCRAARR